MIRHCTFVALVLGVAACHKGGGDGASDAAADSTVSHAVVDATVQPVVAGAFTERVNALGAVAASPGHMAQLGAPVAARVVRLNATVGQTVRPGDTLVLLDPVAFQAATASADAALHLAEQARDRSQRLVGEGIAARRDLEQAVADLARARSESAVARRNADLATLRAPIGGVITAVHTALGAMADPAQALVEIADPAAADVVLSATADDAARMHAGDAVAIRSSGAADASILANGTIADIGGAVDSASQAVAVRVRLSHSDRPLRVGESVAATVAIATRQHAITVPLSALVPSEDGFTIFVVDSANVAHATVVTVGARTDSVAEITHGVSAGERVVTQGAFGVEDGARIGKSKP